jgi:hypothetical protein
VQQYLTRSGVKGPWSIELTSPGPFPGGIIIPALAETDSLPQLLASLVADRSLPESGLLVLFVVNNREDASGEEKADNRRTLALLRERVAGLPFPVGIVDASSPGLCLPLKDGGVGLARKIGHDLLLPRLSADRFEPVMVSLDADTLVSPGYAGSIRKHFRSATAGGAVIPFVHRRGEGERENAAIERYELFLRCYVAGLAAAGSPYAFQTVGSAMACTVSAYLKCGGMNRRRAGEDFYFLQSLAKSSGVCRVAGATVYPSPRRSARVPFGTGRAVGALLSGEPDAVLFHRPESFLLLQGWLALAGEGCRLRCPDLTERAGQLSPLLQGFLGEQGFPSAWAGLLQHNRSGERLLAAFHRWFDAFRTMKFFHFLADGPYPRCAPAEVLHRWPAAWGAAELTDNERLELFRQRENGSCQR